MLFRSFRCGLALVGLLVAPAWGQGSGPSLSPLSPIAGQQSGAFPGGLGGLAPSSPFPQAPFPGQAGPVPQAGLSLAGTWSGQSNSPAGLIELAEAYGADGKFVSVGRLQNGFISRIWGYYRVIQVGPNQLRMDVQLEGFLPREICNRYSGGPMQCQPIQIPMQDTVLLTFLSADQFQSSSQTTNVTGRQSRDPQAQLLQADAPERWVINHVPGPAQQPQPPPTYYPGPFPRSSSNGVPKCDDLQQRRLCSINDGKLITSGGCMVCVGR